MNGVTATAAVNGIMATKEVDNMVRKAETLTSLDELNLSAGTHTYLKNNFDSVNAVIMEGRIDAFEQECGIQLVDKAPKWKRELVSALKDAGFIRPKADFVTTFRVGKLYSIIFHDYCENFVTSIGQLSNVQYENFHSLSNDGIEAVKLSLQERLTERESAVICYRFGLEGENATDLESVGRHFNVTRERIRQIEAKALRKLKKTRNTFPAIFSAPNEVNETIATLKEELRELCATPAFKRVEEIICKLNRMEKMPFKYTDRSFSKGTTDLTTIDELDLSVRAYNCLKRAGINTVADIINLPKEDWFKVRNLGKKALLEIVEKMHEAGHEDFNVDTSSVSHVWSAI